MESALILSTPQKFYRTAINYNIGAQRFDETAQAIAHASGCSIKTDLSKTGAVKVNSVKGRMTLLDAVRTAIKGTTLRIKAVNNGQEIVVE